jgi:hypothetical protein
MFDFQNLTALKTLSRLHVCATLAFAQVIGAVCVMIARATAPNRLGPSSVFPDAGSWDFSQGLQGKFHCPSFWRILTCCATGSPMALPLFWIAMICQIIIVLGYFWFYRKEQLCKSSTTQNLNVALISKFQLVLDFDCILLSLLCIRFRTADGLFYIGPHGHVFRVTM